MKTIEDITETNLKKVVNSFDYEKWASDGFCISSESLNSDVVDLIVNSVEQIRSGSYETGVKPISFLKSNTETSYTMMYSNVHWCNKFLELIALSHSLGKVASDLLNTPLIRLWGTTIIYKSGAIDNLNSVGWHRDMTFWQCVSSPKLLTYWIALDDMNEENGGIEFARGSHLEIEKDLTLSDSKLRNFPKVKFLGKKGQISVHYSLTGHRSDPNKTAMPRRAMTIHLMDGNLHYVPNTPSDNHLNVFLSGGKAFNPFSNKYFPLVYEEGK